MNSVKNVFCDGFETEYIHFGSGDKPLVIIPGLSVQSIMPLAEAVEKQYEIFSADFSVYVFDRRKSLPKEYSVYDIADDTAKVMKALGISGACVFGTSQGGMAAMALAVKYPELVSRLALGSTAARVDKSMSDGINEWIELAEEGNAEKLYLSFAEKLYPKKVFALYRDVLINTAKTVSESDLKRFIILAKGINGFDITDKLSEIKCPVLAIGDTDDAVLGADATKEIAQYFKNRDNFEMFMYSGFGHAVYDLAKDYTKRLYGFYSV